MPDEPFEISSSRIQDMPNGERPREKLAALGPAALNNAELMALFISTGTKGRSAIDIGRDLIGKYGSMSALGNLTVSQLAKEKGLGLAKASKLAAAFELGARVAREQLQSIPLDSPERIYDLFAPQMRQSGQEQVICATIDSRLCHTSSTVISMGTVNQSLLHPREVIRPVIARSAYGFVLIHNHPSGDPSPSPEDHKVTKLLLEAAQLMQVRFYDHVIIGRPSPGRLPYFSFCAAGIIPRHH
ncbi:MAG: DNA repair protein RadC [Akkermansiaceae bacterium]|nr:DNA repair protein RadC [Akkermansiaceae bacterium]